MGATFKTELCPLHNGQFPTTTDLPEPTQKESVVINMISATQEDQFANWTSKQLSKSWLALLREEKLSPIWKPTPRFIATLLRKVIPETWRRLIALIWLSTWILPIGRTRGSWEALTC